MHIIIIIIIFAYINNINLIKTLTHTNTMQNTIFTTDKVQNFPQSFDRASYQELLDNINEAFIENGLDKVLKLENIRIYTSSDELDGFTTFTFSKTGLITDHQEHLKLFAYLFRDILCSATDDWLETYHHIEILREPNSTAISHIEIKVILYWSC